MKKYLILLLTIVFAAPIFYACVEDDDLDVRYTLTLQTMPPDAGQLAGGGTYTEGETVTVEVTPFSGYEFINWTIGEEEVSAEPTFTYQMPAENVTIIASFQETGTGTPVLVHYWHFNNEEMTEDNEVLTDYTIDGLSHGVITYPGDGGAMDFRSHREGDEVSNYNLRMGQPEDDGAVLRLRNPSVAREAHLHIPTTGYRDLVLTYATGRTDNGNQTQLLQVSADGGANWTDIQEPYYVNNLRDEEEGWTEKRIVLSGIDSINDNPNTVFRILFIGEGNDNPSGNNRLDNVSLDGVAIN
jgi:hypothetical protein